MFAFFVLHIKLPSLCSTATLTVAMTELLDIYKLATQAERRIYCNENLDKMCNQEINDFIRKVNDAVKYKNLTLSGVEQRLSFSQRNSHTHIPNFFDLSEFGSKLVKEYFQIKLNDNFCQKYTNYRLDVYIELCGTHDVFNVHLKFMPSEFTPSPKSAVE